MILITHLYDICSTQAHIPVMLASVGLFLFGVMIICI